MKSGTFSMGMLVVACALYAAPASAACKWVDGSDASATGDGGRGVSDWQAHYGAGVANGSQVPKWVSGRLVAMRGCTSAADYARLYSDVSVMIAHYGRKGAGWVDRVDTSAPANDNGRGISDWSAHQAWAGPNADLAATLVSDRLVALQAKLPKDVYAHLYADLSILVANYAR